MYHSPEVKMAIVIVQGSEHLLVRRGALCVPFDLHSVTNEYIGLQVYTDCKIISERYTWLNISS